MRWIHDNERTCRGGCRLTLNPHLENLCKCIGRDLLLGALIFCDLIFGPASALTDITLEFVCKFLEKILVE